MKYWGRRILQLICTAWAAAACQPEAKLPEQQATAAQDTLPAAVMDTVPSLFADCIPSDTSYYAHIQGYNRDSLVCYVPAEGIVLLADSNLRAKKTTLSPGDTILPHPLGRGRSLAYMTDDEMWDGLFKVTVKRNGRLVKGYMRQYDIGFGIWVDMDNDCQRQELLVAHATPQKASKAQADWYGYSSQAELCLIKEGKVLDKVKYTGDPRPEWEMYENTGMPHIYTVRWGGHACGSWATRLPFYWDGEHLLRLPDMGESFMDDGSDDSEYFIFPKESGKKDTLIIAQNNQQQYLKQSGRPYEVNYPRYKHLVLTGRTLKEIP